MSEVDRRHLSAVICLADKELARLEWHERAGAFRALLAEAMPYLRNVLNDISQPQTEVTA